MNQQPIQDGHAGNEANDKTDKTTLKWRYIFDWGFWTGHPLAIFTTFIGGILLASITNFPGGNPKTIWYFAMGLWILLGAIIWWVTSSVVARMEGRELLTQQEIEDRDTQYKAGIRARLDSLSEGIREAKERIAEQSPRQLSPMEQQAIKEAIAPYAGQKVSIMCLLWDTEASRYAQDFADVFKEAGWECGPISNSTFPLDFQNVQVNISKVEKLKDVPPRPCKKYCVSYQHSVETCSPFS